MGVAIIKMTKNETADDNGDGILTVRIDLFNEPTISESDIC